jgi:2-keto-3-deoxy-L-rhamnonate aldolase RhmA
MSAYPNRVKRQLADGQLALGMVLRQARTVDIATIAKTCGFDWISIDMEHTSLDLDTAAQIANASLAVGITPIVRVPGREHYHASRLLDAGAQGIIVPHVDTAEDARAMVSHCRYPPVGKRSLGSIQPQLAFASPPAEEAMRQVDEEMLLVAMLESPEAIENADAIAAVPGVDVLHIGTGDLCAEMGIPGRFSDPRVEKAYRDVTAACRRHGKHAGMAGIHDPGLAQKFIDFGVRFIAGGTDLNFLMAGARVRSSLLRGLLKN